MAKKTTTKRIPPNTESNRLRHQTKTPQLEISGMRGFCLTN
jgi:hypothetical protein